MSTAKQRAAAANARKYIGKKGRGRKKGMRGLGAISILPKNVKNKDIIDKLKAGGAVALGIVGGRMVSKKFFNETEGWKKWLGSAVQTGAGTILAFQKDDFIQMIGIGMTGSGLGEAASKIMGVDKDLIGKGVDLESIEGFNMSGLLNGGMGNLDVFEEQPAADQYRLPEYQDSPFAEGPVDDFNDFTQAEEEFVEIS